MATNNFFLSQKLGFALQRCELKLTVAESCTGGGLAEQITAVAGSSAWFDCGFVTYSNTAKQEVLNVSTKTLEKYGSVSEAVAREMAVGALKHSHADLSLSITGIAGPGGGTKEKPVGMVWFGLAHKQGRCETKLQHFTSGRKQIRADAIGFALKWLLDEVEALS